MTEKPGAPMTEQNKLAEEIERLLDGAVGVYLDATFSYEQWQQIIAALRREPATEAVLRDALIWVNDRLVHVQKHATGAHIAASIGLDFYNRALYQESSDPHGFDLPIGVNEQIILEDGYCFYQIPVGYPPYPDDEELRKNAQPFSPKIIPPYDKADDDGPVCALNGKGASQGEGSAHSRASSSSDDLAQDQSGEHPVSNRKIPHDTGHLASGQDVSMDRPRMVAAPEQSGDYVMVPREPTDAMIRAGNASRGPSQIRGVHNPRSIYRAMLTAAEASKG